MMTNINAALILLINTVFQLYLYVLMIRVIIVWERFDYFNPLTQLVVRLTDFIIKPLRKMIPNMGRYEIATILVIVALEIIKFILITYISVGAVNIIGILIVAAADMIKLLTTTFFYAIIAQVILTWVQPFSYVNRILYDFTAPIMRPLQRVIPTIGGIDITPIPALLLLEITNMVIVNSMMMVGAGIALG